MAPWDNLWDSIAVVVIHNYYSFLACIIIAIIIRLRLHVIFYTENEDGDDQAVQDKEYSDTPAHTAAQLKSFELVFTDPAVSIISIRHNITVFYRDYDHPNFMLQSRWDGLNFENGSFVSKLSPSKYVFA